VEAVFGNLKNNKYYKRFHLRGLKKVEIEFGLLAIAHNLAKEAISSLFCTAPQKLDTKLLGCFL
jgi:hypothetical protein